MGVLLRDFLFLNFRAPSLFLILLLLLPHSQPVLPLEAEVEPGPKDETHLQTRALILAGAASFRPRFPGQVSSPLPLEGFKLSLFRMRSVQNITEERFGEESCTGASRSLAPCTYFLFPPLCSLLPSIQRALLTVLPNQRGKGEAGHCLGLSCSWCPWGTGTLSTKETPPLVTCLPCFL